MALFQVKELLAREELAYPMLLVLQATVDLYTALIVQPLPRIYVSPSEIRNLNQTHAKLESVGAMNLATEQAVDLLVSPEYSVPWQAVETQLAETGGPATGKLWVLGCESIAVADACNLKHRFSQYAVVIHEPIDPADLTPNGASYFNPLIYLFRTRSLVDNSEKVVMLVQFKTYPSGDPTNIEITSMARGTGIYLFEGAQSEVRLLTFICSDVLGISVEDLNLCYENTLLLHVQLNDNPRAPVYTQYRRKLFESRCDRTELICVNWAAGIEFHIEGNQVPLKKTNIAGSAWHTRSEQADTGDARVEANHRAGLFYTRNEKEKCHVLHFSYKPAAFLVRTTKVKHTGGACGTVISPGT